MNAYLHHSEPKSHQARQLDKGNLTRDLQRRFVLKLAPYQNLELAKQLDRFLGAQAQLYPVEVPIYQAKAQ